jgi:GNAT superfamily N-acetyltransferase
MTDDAGMATTPASPSALKRERAGRYVTGDGRFGVEQAAGGWMITDAEQLNELGLPLVRGPFATLDDVRDAIAAARAGPAPVSELAARMASLPPASDASRTAVRRRSGARERAPRAASDAPPPPPPVVRREWQAGDGVALRRLWAGMGMRSIGDDDESLAVMAGRNPGLLRVATVGDRVVGSALGAWDGRRGWIYHVATAPDQRRHGIARRLVAEVEDALRALGCPKVNVIVLDDAEDAAAFWGGVHAPRRAAVRPRSGATRGRRA